MYKIYLFFSFFFKQAESMTKAQHPLLPFTDTFESFSLCVLQDNEEVAEEEAPIQSNICEWEVKPQMVAALTSKHVEAVDTEKQECCLLMTLKEKICQVLRFLVPAGCHSPLHHLQSMHS